MKKSISKTPQPTAGDRLQYVEAVLKTARAGLLLALSCLQPARLETNAGEDATIQVAINEMYGSYRKLGARVADLRRKRMDQSKAQPR